MTRTKQSETLIAKVSSPSWPPALFYAMSVLLFLTVIPLVCAALSLGASGACVRQNGQGSTFAAYTATVGGVQGSLFSSPMSAGGSMSSLSPQNCETTSPGVCCIAPGWSALSPSPFQTDPSIAGLLNRTQRRLDSRPAIGKRENRNQQCTRQVAATTPPTA